MSEMRTWTADEMQHAVYGAVYEVMFKWAPDSSAKRKQRVRDMTAEVLTALGISGDVTLVPGMRSDPAMVFAWLDAEGLTAHNFGMGIEQFMPPPHPEPGQP